MATRDFTAFIMKCVTKAFPDADLNKGSPVWTFLINPIVEYTGTGALDLQAREYIKAVLRSKFPGEELDKDSVIDDVLIKPAEAVLAPITREIQQIKVRQTLADLRFHTIESISDIASNFGVIPKAGDFARGPVRLYFSAPVNERVVPETYVLSTTGGLRFFASSSQSISAAQMALNQENDLYYWDIRVVAEKAGSVFNVDPGAISSAPTLSRVVKVTNLYKFGGGLVKDSVEGIAAELDSYPCTRSIGTRRGTVATIQALIGGARVIEMVGMGDVEMQRDIIRGGEIQPELVYDSLGNPGTGSQGRSVPDNAASIYTTWMEDPAADFVALLGSSGTTITGYYLCMVWDTLTSFPGWAFSRISRVLSTTRIEIQDRIIPVSLSGAAAAIRWAVFPAKLTLSQVPGGILWPDTTDGLVTIRDDEVHVGGCSDTFLLGAGVESTSTSMAAVSDETPVAYGTSAETTAGTPNIRLLDAPVVEILSYASAVRISGPLIEIASYVWGVDDFSNLKAGQVVEIPSLAVKKLFLILYVGKNSATGALRLILDADPGAAGPYNARVIKRNMGLTRDACLHILAGANAGYYKVLSEIEGTSADTAPGCVYRVRVTPPAPSTVSKQNWEIVDKIDINLNDPKVLRVFGTDLSTFAGSSSVFSTSVDFSLYGVKKGDILKISSGPDSSQVHVLNSDPYGLGNRFLELTRPLTSTSVVSFSVYSASTPIALPLVAASKLSLLDADGADLGLDVPYKDPLAAYTSEFTNLSSGVKHESSAWAVGIVAVDGPEIGAGAVMFDIATYPFTLTVWHEQLGYSPIRESLVPTSGYLDGDMDLPQGGFIRPVTYIYAANDALHPGGYDLGTSAGWDDLVARLNDGIPADLLAPPYPFWSWESREEIRAGVNGVHGYLVCRPFGAKLMLLACDNTWLGASPNPPIRFDPFLDYVASGELFVLGLGIYPNQVTSKDLYYGPYGTSDTDLKGLHPPLNVDQDIVDVASGSNTGTKNMLMQIDSTYHRFRIHGRRSYHPELGATTRIGFPSSGTAKLYFRDPTDIEIGGDTRLTAETGEVFWPDPLLNGSIVPGYPETEKPNDIHALLNYPVVPPAFMTTLRRDASQPSFMSLGVLPGDLVEISYRNLITGQDWAGPLTYIAGADQTLYIRHAGKPEIAVVFAAGNWVVQDVVDHINNTTGQTIAILVNDYSALGRIQIALRWQERIDIAGDAIGAGQILDVCPVSNVDPNEGLWPILETGYLLGSDILVRGALTVVAGPFPDESLAGTQFRILRPGTQRFSAQGVSANVGTGGFYFAEGEFLSWGVGNQFNIDVDSKGMISGHWSRGYYLTCENQELSYSMAEVPWVHIGNYFQPPTVDDDMYNDQVVLGGGMRLYYDRSPLVSSAQALETSREEKDNIQSALVRHLFPHYVSFTASYAGGSLPTAVKPEIVDLITGRDPGEPLDVSDIIGVLTQFGANKVDMPITLAVLRNNEDRSMDLLVGDDRVETERLTGFLPGNIVLNRRP